MPSPPFVGQVMAAGFNFAPRGWALCNGQLLPISQYTALFSLLGTNFGGDGRTTFGLPDLRSRIPIGAGQGNGLSDYTLGEMVGFEGITLTLGELASHSHQAVAFGRAGDGTTPTSSVWAAGGAVNDSWYSAAANSAMSPLCTTRAGGNLPHENRQPFLVLNFIIALEGIFPPRG
jgi:microcystin-dependent protein